MCDNEPYETIEHNGFENLHCACYDIQTEGSGKRTEWTSWEISKLWSIQDDDREFGVQNNTLSGFLPL